MGTVRSGEAFIDGGYRYEVNLENKIATIRRTNKYYDDLGVSVSTSVDIDPSMSEVPEDSPFKFSTP